MNARMLARVLGGDVVGADRVVAPGPGHSAADRSMSVLIADNAPDGFVVTSFSNDDWRACRNHVRTRLGFGSARIASIPRQGRQGSRLDHADRRQALIEKLWKESVPIGGTTVERYLTGRGLTIPEEALDGKALRFHVSCPFTLTNGGLVTLPAMMAAMVDIRDSTLVGIHRTALAADGSGKAGIADLGNPKKMLGRAAGACIKLTPDEEVTHGLHIAEGIETALACIGMGFRPVWVALSAGGIANFPVLAGIDALTVFADNDATGRKSAAVCAHRWSAAGKEVTQIIPAIDGRDFADGGYA